MSICRDLIDKVVVDNYNVEIHYKFPVSGNSNTKIERPEILVAASWVGAWGHTLTVIAAAEEAGGNAGNPLDAEGAEFLSKTGIVLLRIAAEMVVEDELEGRGAPLWVRNM
jgi:hypothetical protein